MTDLRDLSDVKVGDTLYDSGIRSDTRQNRKPRTLYVHKVARKYIYASTSETFDPKSYTNEKIDRTFGRTEGWMGYTVYRSEEHYKEMMYRKELCAKIQPMFGTAYTVNVPEITTEKLKTIAAILGIEE